MKNQVWETQLGINPIWFSQKWRNAEIKSDKRSSFLSQNNISVLKFNNKLEKISFQIIKFYFWYKKSNFYMIRMSEMFCLIYISIYLWITYVKRDWSPAEFEYRLDLFTQYWL